MNTNTYVIFTKTDEGSQRSLKVKATGYTVSSDAERVSFEENGKQVAVFNISELVGFVQADHVVN